MNKKIKILLIAILAVFILPMSLLLTSNLLINSSSDGKIYKLVKNIPYRETGLLLGCSRMTRNGRYNYYFKYRIDAAELLLKSNKIKNIIVSGDNSRKSYDESTDMKNELISRGISADRIFCDYAGFRTLDSVVRAKEVFQQNSLTIISPEFHIKRALFLAEHKDISAIGFKAKSVYKKYSTKTKIREQFAKVKSILDVYLLNTQPRFFGPKILISTITTK